LPQRSENISFDPANRTVNTFPLDLLRQRVAELAATGIYIGTSSWKYQGWLGLIYTPEKYMRYFKEGPPKIVNSRFEKTCLAEYALTFKTVCLDAGFYQFPGAQMLENYLSQVPQDFRLSLKVTEDITILRFPNLPRYGLRAGQANPHFLDAELFTASFIGPLTPYREQIGTIIFEFSHFHAGDLEQGRDFVNQLDLFLERLPRGWEYAVEIRNESLLHPAYFAVLKRHNVAHTFNSWSRMPPVTEQIRLIGDETADFAAARFLLKPGRTYEQAVKSFEPYREIKDPNEEARDGLKRLLGKATFSRTRKRYIYVNNRLEGSAPWTISAVLAAMAAERDVLVEKPPDKQKAL
jgi:uncharacterized protein YecE (DUF72 family)